MKRTAFLILMIGLLSFLAACGPAEPEQVAEQEMAVTLYSTPT